MLIPDDSILAKAASSISKDVYHDLLSPAMKNLGKELGDVTSAIQLITLIFAVTGDGAEALHEKFSFDIIHGSFRATTLGTKFLSVCGTDE